MHESNVWLDFNRDTSQVELLFVTSITSALFWVEPEGSRPARVRNGSASFLELGSTTFAVTAAHVLDGWREARDKANAGRLHLAGISTSLPLDIDVRVIDEHKGMDLATFEVSRSDVKSIGKSVFCGVHENWPPPPPQTQQGIILSGYPGAITQVDSEAITFRAAPGGLSVTSVTETDLICQIVRNELSGVLAQGIPPENFNFGGISGAAMLTQVVTRGGILSWALAGVVHQGPNTDSDPNKSILGFELIRGRRSHFMRVDGTLDRERWAHATFTGT